jgi:hypothetical protein
MVVPPRRFGAAPVRQRLSGGCRFGKEHPGVVSGQHRFSWLTGRSIDERAEKSKRIYEKKRRLVAINIRK